MGKGSNGKGKEVNDSGKAKGKGKGNATAKWFCTACKTSADGNHCTRCGCSWHWGAPLRVPSNPRGQRGLGRAPQYTDAANSPTYKAQLLKPANNSVLEAVLHKLDQLEKQTRQSGEPAYTDSPSIKGTDTDKGPNKPLPGREVFVDFDGTQCNLDDLNAMLRPTVRSLGADSMRAGEIREAIDRAHAKRQGQMDPQARVAYLEKILGSKTKEADSNDDDVRLCQEEIDALSAKMERLRSKGAQVAAEITKIKQDILAASAALGDADVRPGFTAKRCDILQKPLFRQWLQHNKPEVYEFQQDTGWTTISDKLLLRFKRYEVHCLRVRYNLGRIEESSPSMERAGLERKTMESANWMFEANEFFPDDLQSFRNGLVEARANSLQADDANLFVTRKRDGEAKPDDDRQKRKRITVTGPYVNSADGGIETLDVDDSEVQSYDVVLSTAVDVCKTANRELFVEKHVADIMYSIDEESETEAEAAKAYILAIMQHAKSIARFPNYEEYWMAMQNGLEVQV